MGSKKSVCGRIIIEFDENSVVLSMFARIMQEMNAGLAIPATDGVVASIKPVETGIETAISDWDASHRIKLSDGTRKNYRAYLTGVKIACGWSSLADIRTDPVLAYMASMVESKRWSNATHNCALSALQSFSRWLKRTKRLRHDFMEDAECLRNDGDDGSRAATTDELRRLIGWAVARERASKKATAPAALSYLLMATTGMRVGTLGMLRWKHFQEENGVPFLRWLPDINKSGHRRECAINSELWAVLQAHREKMREFSRETPVVRRKLSERHTETLDLPTNPDDPEAVVFPVLSPRSTFKKDRDRALIPAEDRRNRVFSPHSCRKWTETTLQTAGCPQGIIDFLMLHTAHVRAQYTDTPLCVQFQHVERLPKLWPGNYLENDTKNNETKPLDDTGNGRYLLPDESIPVLSDKRIAHSAPAPLPSIRLNVGGGSEASGLLDCLAGLGDGTAVESARSIPKRPFRDSSSRVALVTLLRSVASLLEAESDVEVHKEGQEQQS